jgi:hypothetical protein
MPACSTRSTTWAPAFSPGWRSTFCFGGNVSIAPQMTPVRPNSALVTDVYERRCRAFFNAAQRGR